MLTTSFLGMELRSPIIAAPLLIANGDGAPARVLAMVED